MMIAIVTMFVVPVSCNGEISSSMQVKDPALSFLVGENLKKPFDP